MTMRCVQTGRAMRKRKVALSWLSWLLWCRAMHLSSAALILFLLLLVILFLVLVPVF